MSELLHALTLHASWAHAVAHHGKRIENRTWAPTDRMLGGLIAIHAGLGLGDGVGAIRDICGVVVPESAVPRGCIVAVGVVSGWIGIEGERASSGMRLDIEAVEDARREQGPWRSGRYGWVLRDVVALPDPIPCRGAQGLWPVPADAAAQVLAQVARAGRAP